MKKIITAALIVLSMTSITSARGLTDTENDALKEAVKNYVIATNANDFIKATETIPPKIFETIAKMGNMDVATFRSKVIKHIRDTEPEFQYESLTVDTAKALTQEGADGEPYVMLPVKAITIGDGEGKQKKESMMIALLDSGQWYFVRADEPMQLKVLQQAYPALVKLNIPEPKIETLP